MPSPARSKLGSEKRSTGVVGSNFVFWILLFMCCCAAGFTPVQTLVFVCNCVLSSHVCSLREGQQRTWRGHVKRVHPVTALRV